MPFRIASVIMAATLMYSSLASAELYGSMKELLKDYRPESPQCSHEVRERQVVQAAPERRLSADCWITAEHLDSLHGEENPFIADIRSADEYERGHIDGAVRLTASGVEARTFLKDRTIALVGSGKGVSDTLRACERLRHKGFQRTYILRGGMQAWSVAGRPIVGAVVSPASYTAISVPELMAENLSQFSRVLLTHGAETVAPYFPKAVVLAPLSLESALKDGLVSLSGGRSVVETLVLVSETRLNMSEVDRLVRSSRPLSLFVYDGGLEQIHKFVADQRAVWRARERADRKPRCGE